MKWTEHVERMGDMRYILVGKPERDKLENLGVDGKTI
jgi:hypothetical protein